MKIGAIVIFIANLRAFDVCYQKDDPFQFVIGKLGKGETGVTRDKAGTSRSVKNENFFQRQETCRAIRVIKMDFFNLLNFMRIIIFIPI